MSCCAAQPGTRRANPETLAIELLNNKVKPAKPEPKSSVSEPRQQQPSNGAADEKWLESLEAVVEHALKQHGSQQTARFLNRLTNHLRDEGVEAPRVVSTPYINTIPTDKQATFPGDWDMER